MTVPRGLSRARATLTEQQQYLQKLFQPFKSRRGRNKLTQIGQIVHDGHRRDIVDQNLCDWSIKLLRRAGSLPEKNTCDIIDLNPGFGRWSRALHTAIEPRRHVLVDSEPHVYEKRSSRLLRGKGLRFCTAPTLMKALDLSSNSLSPEFIQQHQNLTPEQRLSKNHQLIIVANLVQKKLFSPRFVGSFAKIFMDQVYRATLEDVGSVYLHQHGLIKLLIWVDQEDFKAFLNTSCTQRSNLARRLEAAYHIRAIVAAGDAEDASRYRPWYDVAARSTESVRDRDPFAKSIVTRRRQPFPLPDTDVIPPLPQNFELMRSLPHKPKLVGRFFELYNSILESHPAELELYLSGNEITRTNMETHLISKAVPDFKEFIRICHRLRTANNHYNRINDLAREQIGYERELLDIRRANPDDPSKYFARLKELKPDLQNVRAAFDAMFKDDKHGFNKALDDYRLFLHQSAPWFAREFEPILCDPTDFYPEKPMALLEFNPKKSFVQRINTSERRLTFEYVNYISISNPLHTVDTLIAKLVGSNKSDNDNDAYNEFVQKLPSLTDPLYGGYWDLSDFRVRTLSTEQLIDITLVYDAWLYRKSIPEMMDELFSSKRGRE